MGNKAPKTITEILVIAANRAQLSVLLKDAGINPATTGWRYVSTLDHLEKYAVSGNPVVMLMSGDEPDAVSLCTQLHLDVVMRLASGRLRFCVDSDIKQYIRAATYENVTVLPKKPKDWPVIKLLAADVLHATGRFNQRDISAALGVSYHDAGDMLACLDIAALGGET